MIYEMKLLCKVNADTCIAPEAETVSLSERSDTDHTVPPANDTISAFNSVTVSIKDGATMHSSEGLTSTYYSFIDRKRMNG